jgi:hypothetical protein
MGGVRDEIFEVLEYNQELALDRRVEASNSCVRTLIFGSFSFIAFLSGFFCLFTPFSFFWLCVLLRFPFFCLVFYHPSFPPLFCLCFLAHMGLISRLPQLAGLKGLVVVVVGYWVR